VNRRRIQPKPAVELEAVSLRLPAQLVRAVEQYAKYLGGSTDRTYVIAQAIEIALRQDAEFQSTLRSR
jgi:predicted transcriptional regulator